MRSAIVILLALFPTLAQAAGLPQPKGQIIAYVFAKESVIQPGEIAAGKLTRINYAFANLKDGRIVEGFAHDAENFAALNALKKINSQLAVLVSVGGWTWSGQFSDVSLTKESRKVFIDSAVAFVTRYQLDGLDVDWEYPGLTGYRNRFRPEDQQNYTLLLKELRQRFDQEGERLHKHLFTSIAAGASQKFLDHTEMSEVQKYVDTVNLMAYDYYEPTSSRTTGHHAPLFTNPADPKLICADTSVRSYEKAGVPNGKIVLGVPFYGHVWGGVPAVNNGLFQPGKEVRGAYADYSNIAAHMLNNGFTRYWDKVACAPYLYNSNSQTFVSYEDPESLALKARYVQEQGLAGIMFWDYEGDPQGSLLTAVHSGLYPAGK